MEFHRRKTCRGTAHVWGTVLCVVAATLGCERPTAPSADEARRPERTSVALRVLVVNATDLAKAIDRQRGEWRATSSDTYSVEQCSLEELLSGQPLAADLVVFPGRYLGSLCDRGLLRPVRDGILESEEFDAADVFPLVRERLLRYGGETMTLPLGVVVPLMCYRSDLLRDPPVEWDDYAAAVGLLADRNLPAVEPIAGQAAYLLLARAAPLAVHSHYDAVLFDLEDMHAKIDDPPYVKALQILADAHRNGGIAAGSYAKVRDGVAGMAISLALDSQESGEPAAPSKAAGAEKSTVDSVQHIAWDELPGSRDVYNPSLQQWEAASGDARRVPLLGLGDQLVAVTTASRNGAGAFRLLSWLASREVGNQLGPEVAGLMPCRTSQLADAEQWFPGSGDSTTSARLGDLAKRALSRDSCLVVPRITGIDEYLDALGKAVVSVMDESTMPEVALKQAAGEWDAITERLGRQEQLASYRRHLNLDD